MKIALLAFLAFLNLLGIASFAAGVFIAVFAAISKADASVTIVISLLAIGALPPALTAAVLFKTSIISAGETWGEIATDLKPLLPWGRNG